MREQILLMTRPLRASKRFVSELDPSALSGVKVVYAPLIDIVATGNAPVLEGYQGAIFTSAHGVEFAPSGDGMAAYCVGERTARQAQASGWDVKLTGQDADQLVDRVGAAKITGPLVHLSGKHRRGDIAERLIAQGIPVDVQVLYDQPLNRLTSQAAQVLSGEVPVILPLFSPRTAAHLSSQVEMASTTTVIAISTAVAKAAHSVRFKSVLVVQKPTGIEMVADIEKRLRQNRLS